MSSDSSDFLKDKKKKYLEEIESLPKLDVDYTTVSSEPIEVLYTPDDIADVDYMNEIGFPGEYPYTRGVHKNMYRGKLWTMRMFSGMGSAKDTNDRYHYLLKGGQTGLSVAFDLPTLYGYDSDHEAAHGEVGKCGVAIDSLKDMETLFGGIDLNKITTSMTINGPAAIILALYLACGEKKVYRSTNWREPRKMIS